MRQFVYSYATEENDEAALPAGSVSQALTMMNDRIVEGALAIEPGTLLFDVAHDATDDAAKIRRLSRSALLRNPTQAELHAALAHLHEARKRPGRTKAATQAAANALADVLLGLSQRQRIRARPLTRDPLCRLAEPVRR